MILKKGYINDLFFVYNSKPLKDLSEYVSFDKFKEIMIEKLNFCNDEKMLDYIKLKKMYEQYKKVFIEHVGNFREYFLHIKNTKEDRCNIKPYLIYDEDLWINKKGTSNKCYYTNRCYKEEYINDLIKERQNLCSKHSFEQRYGKDWKLYYDEYINKRQTSLNNNPNIELINYNKGKLLRYEYYLDKINEETGLLYTEEEAKEIVRKRQQRGGKVISERRKGKKGVTCRSVEYWINKGLSEEEAKEKVRKIHSTNNVQTYIKKYGEQEGIQKWIERNKKWGEQMQRKKMEIGHVGSAQSKSANKLFDKVIEKLKDENIIFEKIYYGEKEFCKWDNVNKRVYFYDFVIPEINLCVEYNGVHFHPKEGDVNWVGLFSGIGYEEKLQYDKEKLRTIEDCGFKTLVIWEDDDENMCINKVVNMCIELLKK